MLQMNGMNILKRTSQFFYEKSNLKTAILCTTIFAAYIALVMTRQAIGFEVANSSLKSLGMTFGFQKSDIISFFQLRTEKMMSAYIGFNLIWDTIFALIYGVMYSVWLSLLLKASAKEISFINLIPFVQVLFDWSENFSLAYLAQQYLSNETISQTIANFSSGFVMIKWISSGLTYFMIILAIGFLITGRFKKK